MYNSETQITDHVETNQREEMKWASRHYVTMLTSMILILRF